MCGKDNGADAKYCYSCGAVLFKSKEGFDPLYTTDAGTANAQTNAGNIDSAQITGQ